MAQPEAASPPAFPESEERKIILLLCCLAAIHIFILSAAFPPMNNVDEEAHFDLVLKYSHGHVPRGIEPFSTEAARDVILYGSLEYHLNPSDFPGGKFPPPAWSAPSMDPATQQALIDRFVFWAKHPNYECPQPPLYYALAGLWLNAGKELGFKDGALIYWLRFLNILFVVALVLLGYGATRIIFPQNLFIRMSVPALLAFVPQSAFYSIGNDILSPLCFGLAFLCLAKMFRQKIPSVRWYAVMGLALAATFLAKTTNLPLLAIVLAFLFVPARRLMKEKKMNASLASWTALLVCALLPVSAWMIVSKNNFGDFTGEKLKAEYFGWTIKPWTEWWQHPIFSPSGAWTYLSGELATFWQGEFWWFGKPMGMAFLNIIYTLASLLLPAITLINLFKREKVTPLQSQMLYLGMICFVGFLGMFAFLSVIYDFHDCVNPSRAHPFFAAGRMMLGMLIPFLIVVAFALDCLLKPFGTAIKFSALASILLAMLSAEIFTDWPAFFSQYNWFHM